MVHHNQCCCRLSQSNHRATVHTHRERRTDGQRKTYPVVYIPPSTRSMLILLRHHHSASRFKTRNVLGIKYEKREQKIQMKGFGKVNSGQRLRRQRWVLERKSQSVIIRRSAWGSPDGAVTVKHAYTCPVCLQDPLLWATIGGRKTNITLCQRLCSYWKNDDLLQEALLSLRSCGKM